MATRAGGMAAPPQGRPVSLPRIAIPKIPQRWAARQREWVFAYDMIALAILLLLAWSYFLGGGWSVHRVIPAPPLPEFTIFAIWFGALGGIAISLKGVYDHDASDWQAAYNLWHLGRPISGGIAGGLTYLLLWVSSKAQPSDAVVLAAAFILGTQEKRFFNFLYEVARLIVQVPNDTSAADLAVTEIQPPQAPPGAKLTILGRGFDPAVSVTVGGTKLLNTVVSRDGATIGGILPPGTGTVDLLIVNPDGTARLVAAKFTYQMNAELSPTSLLFGVQQVGAAGAALTVTVTNRGAGSLTLSNFRLVGPNADAFAITASTCDAAPVAVGAACTVDVGFAPKAAGDLSATLTLTDRDGTEYTVPLSGTGVTRPPPPTIPASGDG